MSNKAESTILNRKSLTPNAEWGGKHNGMTANLGEFGRVSTMVYDGGVQINGAEIHIIETYMPRADGVTEGGGMLVTSVPFENEAQASTFYEAFERALKKVIPSDKTEYSADNNTRNTIRQIAQDTYAKLSGGMQ